MKKIRAKAQEFHSMKEYEKRYYPESHEQKPAQVADTNRLGIVMARESLNKFKHLIQKQKVCIK
jgi:hypothetical protein